MDQSVEICVRHSDSSSRIRVNKGDSVSSLRDHFPGCDFSGMQFAIGNQLLMPAFSFAFYRVRDGDEIVLVPGSIPRPPVLPTSPHRHQLPNLAQLRRRFAELYQLFGDCDDAESVLRAIEDLIDPDLDSEIARLKDQYFRLIEGNSLSHRKLIARYLELMQPQRVEKMEISRYEAPSPKAPSTEALPCSWAQTKKSKGRD